VQDPDLDSLRLCNPLQGYYWLGLVRRSCMTSGSATRWYRAGHSFPERELLPFRPLLQHRRLDGRPPVQGLLQRDSRSGSRSSVHCSDDSVAAKTGAARVPGLPLPTACCRRPCASAARSSEKPAGWTGGIPVQGFVPAQGLNKRFLVTITSRCTVPVASGNARQITRCSSNRCARLSCHVKYNSKCCVSIAYTVAAARRRHDGLHPHPTM